MEYDTAAYTALFQNTIISTSIQIIKMRNKTNSANER